ncbi:Uncharacterised protein [Legionella busanensis]|uniref:Uncharacterized protein n=1 Tax=Legionella busanensis TaxID=190655 RepID=A0A378JKX7_9GAMM|nr:Uncharacterised protein [Legionella busanensis]
MWNPNVKLSIWFKIYPALAKIYPLTCLCGKQLSNIFPYVTKNYVGIMSEGCSCGIGKKLSGVPRNEECKHNILNAMQKLITE